MRNALPSPVRRLAGTGVVAALIAATACDSAPPKPVELRMATGSQTWYIVGRALSEQYNRRLPNVRVAPEPIADLELKVDALQRDELDLAFVDAETAYRTYKRGTESLPAPHTHLRAIAVLFSTFVHIITRADAGIDTVRDLRGRRLNVGNSGGYPDQAARLILKSYGLDYTDVEISFGRDSDPADALRSHEVDALVFWTPLYNQTLMRVVNTVDVRLLPLDRDAISAAQSHNQFLKSMVIPAGTYPNQLDALQTVGDDVLLLCREDLPDQLVRDLTAELFDAVPALVQAHPVAGGINPNRGPTASIPLHPGAARFYRERELLR